MVADRGLRANVREGGHSFPSRSLTDLAFSYLSSTRLRTFHLAVSAWLALGPVQVVVNPIVGMRCTECLVRSVRKGRILFNWWSDLNGA